MDLIFRGLAVYLFLLLLFRISGKRSLRNATASGSRAQRRDLDRAAVESGVVTAGTSAAPARVV
jgi:hypothetical protein